MPVVWKRLNRLGPADSNAVRAIADSNAGRAKPLRINTNAIRQMVRILVDPYLKSEFKVRGKK